MSSNEGKIPALTKIIYGTGDWGMASFNTIRQIYYAIFLTDVVGLKPGIASFAALFGIIWDAINDPIIGFLSDRINTRWGRRRPFLLIFSVPFGLAFLLLWWAPPWETQMALAVHVTLAYMITDTLQTLITVPFLSLTPEMTEDYDERTSLSTYRMFFNLLASLAAAAGAPEIVAMLPTAQQGYLIMGAIFGGLGVVPYLAIFFTAKEAHPHNTEKSPTINESLTAAWRNVPFRIATGINVLNWVTFDLVALMLPFFLRYWISKGQLNMEVNVPVIGSLTINSLVFLILLSTAILFLPVWNYLSNRWNKRVAYIAGMTFWVVVQMLILTINPGQYTYIIILAFFAGISVSTAHVIPEALFPDIIEWDELFTGQRREGLYYGLKTFVRKLTSALSIFIALQTLEIFNYQIPPDGITVFQQPDSALLAIRILTGPAGAVILIGAITMTFLYPIDREKHQRIQKLLARQRARQEEKAGLD